MKTLTQQLSNYAAYHRDRRNIATHFVGIPVIVISVAALLSRPVLSVGGLPLSPAVLVTACAVAYYLALDLRFGLVMLVAMAGSVVAGAWLAAMSTTMWLASSIGLFVGGWIVQFVGHIFEGRKPAFVDDLVGLLIGPLFVVAEAGFAMGLRRELHAEIEAAVGPTRVGRAPALRAP